MSIGFDLQRLLAGENPFVPLEGICTARRNLRRELEDPPHRNSHQPIPVLVMTRRASKANCADSLQGCPGRFCLRGSVSQIEVQIANNLLRADVGCDGDNPVTGLVLELCVESSSCPGASVVLLSADTFSAGNGAPPANAVGGPFVVTPSPFNLANLNSDFCLAGLPTDVYISPAPGIAPCAYTATYRVTFY